jgi:hypothetical protein
LNRQSISALAGDEQDRAERLVGTRHAVERRSFDPDPSKRYSRRRLVMVRCLRRRRSEMGVGSPGGGKIPCMRSSDAAASVGFLAGAVGLIALLAVFVFWGGANSSDALPYFAVPGALFALSAALGYRVWHISRRGG